MASLKSWGVTSRGGGNDGQWWVWCLEVFGKRRDGDGGGICVRRCCMKVEGK
jgi:hypothetical protein